MARLRTNAPSDPSQEPAPAEEPEVSAPQPTPPLKQEQVGLRELLSDALANVDSLTWSQHSLKVPDVQQLVSNLQEMVGIASCSDLQSFKDTDCIVWSSDAHRGIIPLPVVSRLKES